MIVLEPIYHNKTERVLLRYAYPSPIDKIVRSLPGVRWSKTHKTWHIPLSEADCKQTLEKLRPLAAVDTTALSNYLHQRKGVQATLQVDKPKPAAATPPPDKPVASRPNASIKQAAPLAAYSLSPQNLAALQKMVAHLQLKAYSPSTLRTYRGGLQTFLLVLGKHDADSLSTADVKRYLLKCINEGLGENAVHSRMNALKFYHGQVLGRDKFFVEIPRPKKPLQLPAFFNQDEITNIIKGTENLKHKTMLMLAYSAGLRVSEVVAIKVWQIDSKRMQILIQHAKGKKDRITPLSPVLLVMLREYFTVYKPDKKGYLFAGDAPNEPYSTRSLQRVLQMAKERAGVLKPGSTHALRHSFATHLLDKGTDVTMIMKLLGHNDIKTTLRYLHVTNRDELNLISPLDDLKL